MVHRALDLRHETKRGTSVYNGIFNLLVLRGARDWMAGTVPQYGDLDGPAAALQGQVILDRADLVVAGGLIIRLRAHRPTSRATNKPRMMTPIGPSRVSSQEKRNLQNARCPLISGIAPSTIS